MKLGTILFTYLLFSIPWKTDPLPVISFPPDHAIYIGVIQVLHEEAASTAEVNVKVFTDDMQNALRNAFKDYQVIPEEEICEQQQELLVAYFAEHLTFEVNGTVNRMEFKSCTKENDVYWLTFEMSCPAVWKTISVDADFFMEIFPTQSNMVSLHHGGERRFFRLTKRQSAQEILF